MVDNCTVRVQSSAEAGAKLGEGCLPVTGERGEGTMHFRGASVEDAVGACFQLPHSDSDSRRVEVLHSVGTTIRRQDPATQERLDRREVSRREGVTKLARTLRFGDDVERRIVRLERGGQELPGKELKVVVNRESLSLMVEVFHRCGRVTSGDDTETVVLHGLDFPEMRRL